MMLNDAVLQLYYGHHHDGCNCAAHSNTMSLSHRIANTINKVIELAEMKRTSKIRNAIADIFNTDSKALNKDIFDIYQKDYIKALDSVFDDIDSNHPLWEKVQQFKINAANFAAHKTYQLQQKLNVIKIDVKKDNGSEKDFINKAKPIINRFNNYQKTEYNTFVARSRSAKQWDTFQQEKHLFPNLEWIRTRSANPRELHLSYVGLVLPINDPFWQQNQPGNLYNCKCDWKSTNAETTKKPAKIIKPMAGLEGNPYYTSKIITDNHPYFKDVSKANENKISHFIMQKIRENNTSIVRKSLQNNSIIFNFENKNHKLIFSNRCIRHIFHNTHTYQNLKNMSIPYIPEILKSAILEYVVFAEKNDEKIKRYLYFRYNILDKPAYINIKELENGDMKVYAITPSIKK
jgi:hypothetical protein